MSGICTPSRVCGDCHERPHLRQSGNLETADFEGAVRVWPPGDDSPLGAHTTHRADQQRPPQQQGMEYGQSAPVVTPEAVKVVEASSPSKEKPRQHQHYSICGGPLLDEEEAMKNANWLLYCCCGGCASSCTQCRPLQCAMETLCCTNVCFTAECTNEDSGPCKVISDCLCCTTLCQAPPRSGRPRCVVCNLPCCGAYDAVGRPQPDEKGRDADFDRALDDGCVPCFCCTCCGVVLGLTAISQHVWKCGCFECKQKVGLRRGFRLCGSLCSCICCLGQVRLPCYPTPPSPCIAICGHRCRQPGGYSANWARHKHKDAPVATKSIPKMNFDTKQVPNSAAPRLYEIAE